MIAEIKDYKDLIKKIEYDIERYRKNNHVYELIDCLMSLSSLPEWISKNENASDNLRKIVDEKLLIMRGQGFEFNENEVENNIDHKLRFVRLYCNQTKHSKKKGEIPKIISKYGATLPFTFPGKLYNIIAIGEKEYDAEYLINDVYNYWNKLINE
jgi:hypothetical protein